MATLHGSGDDPWLGGSWASLRRTAEAVADQAQAAEPVLKAKRKPRASIEGLFSTGAFPLAGSASQAWTDNRFEMVRHFRHWVAVAIERITSAVSSVRPQVSVRDPYTPPLEDSMDQPAPPPPPPDSTTGWQQNMPAWRRPGRPGVRRLGWDAARHKAVAPILADECIEPVEADHPLLRLLYDCNPYDTCADVWIETVLFYELTGSAYWWLPKNAAGLPGQIWVLPSHWVWPVPGKDRMTAYYQIRPLMSQQIVRNIAADEVLQFRRPGPLSKIDGSSHLTESGVWVDAFESLDSTRKNTLRNGIRPGLAIELDPNVADPDQDILDRYMVKIMDRFSGEHKAGMPFWVPPGAKVKPWTMSPRELDLGETSEQYRDNILATFGVPLPVAGISKDQTYGGQAAAIGTFWTLKVNPLLRFFGQRLTEQLAARYDPALVVWFPDGTPEDVEQQETELQNDVKAGAITRGEYRLRRGLPLLGDARDEELLGQKPKPEKHPNGRTDTGANDPRKPNYDGGENLDDSK